MLSGANPFQLQTALHSALKLRFFKEWGTLGLPIRETRIGALSSACGRRARFANAHALFAISVMLNPAQRVRDFNPQDLPEGIFPSGSLLRFAAV